MELETKSEFLISHRVLIKLVERVTNPMIFMKPQYKATIKGGMNPGDIIFTDDPPKVLAGIPNEELVIETFCGSHKRLGELI